MRFRATCRTCETPFSVRWDEGVLRTEAEEILQDSSDERDVLPRGTRVGKYEIEEPLASGGSSTVYKAFDAGANRTVALKVLHQAPDSDFGLRFRREVEVQGNLKHQNLMPIFDHGTVDGKPYYTMELLQKPMTLDTIIGLHRNGRLTYNPTLRKLDSLRALLHQMLLPVARAIAFTNQHGIIHRDLKPSNVIVDAKTLRVYVIDFGICHLFRTTGSRIMLRAGEPRDAEEQRRLAMGTVRCMPPEQARGEVSPQGDVWALGALLRFMLTGDFPVAPALDLDRVGLTKRIANLEKIAASSRAAGDEAEAAFYEARVAELRSGAHRTMKDLLRDAQQARYGPLPDSVDAALAAIVDRAMRTDPKERYPNAEAFAADVQAWLDNRAVRAYSLQLGGAKAALYRARLSGRRYRTVLFTVAAVLGLVVAGAAIYLFQVHASERRLVENLLEQARRAEDPAVKEQKLLEVLRVRPGDQRAEALLGTVRRFAPLQREVEAARQLRDRLEEKRRKGERILDREVRDAEEKAAVLKASTIPLLRELPEEFKGRELANLAEQLERELRGEVIISLKGLPSGAEVALVTARSREERDLAWDEARVLGTMPLKVPELVLGPGSYVLCLRRAETGQALYLPFQITHATHRLQQIDCPIDPADIPEGMVYVSGVKGMEYGDLRFTEATERVDLEPFFLDVHEVTNEQYRVYLDALEPGLRRRAVPRRLLGVTEQTSPLWTENPDGTWMYPEGAGEQPVTGVSLLDAEGYARWAGKRLPTAPEWERAARGVDRRDFPFGMRLDPTACNAATGTLADVGSFPADRSPFGVMDMGGNAAEWTATSGGAMATIKGGSFDLPRYRAMAAAFEYRRADLPYRDVGFRCAR